MGGYCRNGGSKAFLTDVDDCRKGNIPLDKMTDKYGGKYGDEFVEKICTIDYKANPYFGTQGRHRYVEPTYRKYPDKEGFEK